MDVEAADKDWSTYRGNAQRTANNDGKPGPDKPKVLWVLRSQEHFIAAPVPAGERVFVSSLGGFNVSRFYCLNSDPAAKEREQWLRSTPYLKLPTVSSPAVVDDLLIFGDGMHQTSGAFLHCFDLKTGLPLWQLPVPGELVHLEGTPTVVGNRLYMGGGAAGVLCVQIDKLSLDGKRS
ncbi:MAG: PQQ-binding-like beta-propeller repeat protein, partial [Gemmataceae bacterium]